MGFGRAIMMDLSKAFDIISHSLLIAKCDAYAFDKPSLKLVSSYLNDRWQIAKVNTAYSDWIKLDLGVIQEYILESFLFNIYINDLTYIIQQTDVCNYADVVTIHSIDTSFSSLINRLEHDV